MHFGTTFVIFVLHTFLVVGTYSKLMNLKNVWMLPEDNYEVFYRYFDEQISWFEAENVCNFHHGNLITLKNENNMDVLKAYLKELEINDTFWIGLNRKDGDNYYSWPDNEQAKNVQLRSVVGDVRIDNVTSSSDNNNQSMNCVSIEPNFEFQLTKSSCDRPISATFICEVQIPEWANNASNGCLLTSAPSVTTIYIMEDDVFELVSDCGLQGTKSVTCKDKILFIKCDIVTNDRPWTQYIQLLWHARANKVNEKLAFFLKIVKITVLKERCDLMDQLSCDFDNDDVVDNETNFKITTHPTTTTTPTALHLILTPKPSNFTIQPISMKILTPKPQLWNNENASNVTEQDNFEQGLIEIDVSNIEEDANSTATDNGYEMQVATVQNLTVIENDEANLANRDDKGHIQPYVISRFVG